MNHFLFSWVFSNISRRLQTHFHPPVFMQTDVTALQTQRGLGIFAKKPRHQTLLYSGFSENRKHRLFEALFQ